LLEIIITYQHKEDKMLSKRVLTVGAMMAAVILLLAGTLAWAESYSLSREIKSGSFGSLALPSGIAVGPDGRMYISDTSNNSVLVLDEYGDIATPGISYTGDGSFLPFGTALDMNGNFYYVSNSNPDVGAIYRFSTADGSFTQWGSSGTGNGQFSSPTAIAVGPDGAVYVTDTANNRVQKFSPNGTFLTKWGSAGTGNGQFMDPQGIGILGSLILVSDTDNNRLEGFDENGTFLGSTEGSGLDFFLPSGIAIGPDNSIFIAEIGNSRVQKISGDGITFIGQNMVSTPQGLAVDRGGNLYVADSGNNRIAVFTPDIVAFESGQKVITGNAPFGATFSIQPDAYWKNAPRFELFLWLEAFGGKAYWASLPLGLVVFNSPSEMKPLLSAEAGVPSVPPVNFEILSDSSGIPAATYTIHLCLDRDVNGVFNPSASVCGQINLIKQ
jgi:DNA-binding beta-propeller fold protein YncE